MRTGGGGLSVLILQRCGKEDSTKGNKEALENKDSTEERTKSAREGMRRAVQITSFLTNDGDPNKEWRVQL